MSIHSVIASDTLHQLQTVSLMATQDQDQTESQYTTQALTKFRHDLHDVPFQKTHLSSDLLESKGIVSIEQAINQVSGVFHQNNYGGGFWDNYSFRGFQGNPNMGADRIRNGLSVNRGLSAPQDLSNVESLDFLKGPSAALYGRGEVGGALNVTTKKAKWDASSEFKLQGTTLDQYRISASHTAPISDVLAYRMTAAIEDNQSFRDHVTSQRFFFAPTVSWKISEHTQLDFDHESTQHSGSFDRGLTAVNNQLIMDAKTFTGEPNDEDMRVKDHLYQVRLHHDINDEWKTLAAISYKDAQMIGYSTEPRRLQADLTTLERQRRYRDYQSEDVLAQTEFLGQFNFAGYAHELVLGLETGQLDFTQLQYRLNHSASQPNWIDIYQPIYGKFSPDLVLHTDSAERQKHWAIHLQDQIFINDQWNVLVGGRFEHVDQRFINHRTLRQDNQTDQQVSPRFGLNYRPTHRLSFYANYGEAFSMNNGMGRMEQTFAPEHSKSYEIGTKYQWSTKGAIHVAVFNMVKRNVLMTDVIDPNFEAAVGEVKSRGAEIDLNHQFTKQFGLNANYAFVDARVSKDDVLPSGSPLSNVPKHSFNINAHYDFIQSAQYQAGMHVGLSYVDKRSGDSPTQTSKGFYLPAYTIVNAGAYYQANAHLRYLFNIHNLFNQQYYLSSYSSTWIQAGEPLKASLALQWTH